MSRSPYRRRENPTVWTLARVTGSAREHLGVSSTDLKAVDAANAIIAKEAGLARLRLPAWVPLPDGGHEVIYGRAQQSWRFQVRPEPVDAEAA